jgi:hypothetical protein
MPSDKITSKNLSYEQKLPPFLARLHGHQVSDSSSPDPILAARRRPGRVRSASEEAEDAPVVVDENGNVVDVKVAEDGDDEEAGVGKEQLNGGEDVKKQVQPEDEKVARIGATKKRKAGKVIGGDDEVDAEIAKAVKASKAVLGNTVKAPKSAETTEKADVEKGRAAKKKAKKVKLSFGDDD